LLTAFVALHHLRTEALFPALYSKLKEIPKEWTEIYREIAGNQIELTSTEEPAGKFVWPRQGGVVTVEEGAPLWATHIEILIEPGNWYVTLLRDGEQVMVMHKTFSKDGKTMQQTRTIRDPQGKFIEIAILVFDKQ